MPASAVTAREGRTLACAQREAPEEVGTDVEILSAAVTWYILQGGYAMNEQDAERPRWQPTAGNMILMSIEGIAFLAQVVLCVSFYDSLNLHWLLYFGWATLAVAMVLGWRARVAFQAKGGSGVGESWLHTRTVVDTAIYAVVRHPMYLSFQLTSLSLVLLSQHWLNVVLGVIVVGLLYNDMCREEKDSLERFGDDYRRYMEHVPRMNLVVGTIRRMQSKS